MPDTVLAPATPAAPAPLMTVDAIIARAEGQPAPKTETPAASPKTATINMDPATLKQLTKLQRQNRELSLKAKAADEQAQSKDTLNAIEARRLLGEGKRIEALALLAGTDPDAELLSLIEDQVKGAPEEKDALTKQVEEMAKRLEAADKEKADAAVVTKAREAEAAKSAAVSFATKALDATKYELCGNPANQVEAVEAALDGVVFLANERKMDLDKLSESDTTKLFDEVYAGIELQLEAEGKQLAETLAKRFSKGRPAYRASDDDYVPGASRTSPGISISPPRAGNSIDDIVARAEEKAAARRAA